MDYLTFKEFITLYYLPYIACKDSKTIDTYRRILRSFALPVLGDVPMQNICLAHLETIHTNIKDRGVAISYQANLSTILYQVFQLAQSLGILQQNPYDIDYCSGHSLVRHYPYVHIQPRKTAWLSPDELARLVPCFQNNEQKNFFLLCLYSGLRYQEAAALYIEDYDPLNHALKIHRVIKRVSKDHHLLLLYQELPENDRSYRTIRLSPSAEAAVQSAVRDRILDDEGNQEHLLFTIPSGKPICYARLCDYCKVIQRETGIYHFRLSLLRTTFAITCLNHGWSAAALMSYMGCASSTLTMYKKAADEAARSVMSSDMLTLVPDAIANN